MVQTRSSAVAVIADRIPPTGHTARRTNRRLALFTSLVFALFLIRFFSVHFVAIHPAAKVLKGTNRNMPARNTMVQLVAMRATVHNVTERQTDRLMPIADHSV